MGNRLDLRGGRLHKHVNSRYSLLWLNKWQRVNGGEPRRRTTAENILTFEGCVASGWESVKLVNRDLQLQGDYPATHRREIERLYEAKERLK